MKKISQYSFVDSSIVNVLFLDNVIGSSYDEGMIDLLLENTENKSIVEPVLSYFLEKSKMLNLFSDKTKLGYNPETNVYYFGTDSQLALNNGYVVVDANGDVLDNNKGEGFATESKAITRYELKTFGHTSKDEEKRLSKKIKRHYE